MAKPTNVFVRDYLTDNGDVPNYGGLNLSPDIVPQLSPADPSKVQQLYGLPTYGQDIATQEKINIEAGQSNYIYMRAKNPTNASLTVQLSLYWSSGGTLQIPSQWINQQIGQSQQITIPATTVRAAPEPFIWTPLQLPDLGHYCLIAQVTWNGFNGITKATTFPNLAAWWTYCRNNNTIAQRNMEMVNVKPNNRVEWNLDLLNPDPNPLLHTVMAVCNVPEGSTVALYCSAPQLNPPISTGPVTILGTDNNQNVIASTMFPANFQGTLQLIFQPPGNAQPGLYSIVAQQYAASSNGKYEFLGSYTFEITISLSDDERKTLIIAHQHQLLKKLLS